MDILKKFGRDENLVENGAEFYFGDDLETVLVLRHASSKAAKAARNGLTNKEKQLLAAGAVEKLSVRKVIAKVIIAAIVEIKGEAFSFGGKKLAKTGKALLPVFEDPRAVGFLLEVLDHMNDDTAFGITDFEDNSKNS